VTIFWLLAAGLGVAALALVLPAVLRSQLPARASANGRTANLVVLRGQLAQIDADHVSGALDVEQHRLARAEVARRVLDEESAAPATASDGSARRTAIGLGVLVPGLALAFYAVLGTPAAIGPLASSVAAEAGAESDITPEKIAQMVDLLNERTRDKPQDLEAWTLLGHALRGLQRFPEAAAAYARASQLAPADAELLADLAYALAMQSGTAAGEPTRLLKEALRLAPENLKALSLAGSAAFERKEFAQAIGYWSRARSFAPPGSAFIADIDQSLAQAREAAGLAQGAPGSIPPPTSATSDSSASTASGSATTVRGRVSLAPALAAKAKPTDTVFIFARASDGPRMPLAILKTQVSELPLDFVLDDSTAMSPAMTLSRFKTVVVGARVSASGQASPTAGDLVGQTAPLALGSDKVELVIDGVQP